MARILPFVVLAFVLLGVLYWRGGDNQPFYISGYIEAHEVRVGSRVGGRVGSVPAEEGAIVATGDPLVELEPYTLHEQLARAKAALAAEQAQLAQLEAGFRKEDIAQARAQRDAAKASLDKAVAGLRPLEISILEDAVDVANAELAFADSDFKRVKKLHEAQQAAEDEFDAAQRAYSVAVARVAQARDQLALAREGTRAEELAEARALLSQREADLQRMEAGYRVEEIAAARAQASAAEAEVASIERQLRELAVASPCDCLVEAVDLEPGDLVAANAPVLTLIDPHDLWIRAYIPENRLDISVGQKVSIRVDAFPERRFAGHVSFVSRKAEFTPANVQTPDERVKQMFRVKVELDEGQDTLRAGMAADVFLEAPAK
ncbi:MAG: HlyD family efflux transporter periplasmic adaptor subunit [Phycisphaerales bacterium]|nr:HlyD family efflux transporter periplasmic adaptor subunit [Phycisphaerales bacterium]